MNSSKWDPNKFLKLVNRKSGLDQRRRPGKEREGCGKRMMIRAGAKMQRSSCLK
jgi:hypothetical protein